MSNLSEEQPRPHSGSRVSMGGQRRINMNGGGAIIEKPKNSPTVRRALPEVPSIPPPSPPMASQPILQSSPQSTPPHSPQQVRQEIAQSPTKRTVSQNSIFTNSRPLGVSQHTISKPKPPQTTLGRSGDSTPTRRNTRSGTMLPPIPPPSPPVSLPTTPSRESPVRITRNTSETFVRAPSASFVITQGGHFSPLSAPPVVPPRAQSVNYSNKPKIPPKPAVLTEEEHTKLCESFKKFSNANKQLVAIARAAQTKVASNKKIDVTTLETKRNDLADFNSKFTEFVKEAAKDFDHKQTCKVACLTVDISNFTANICSALKEATLECVSDDSFFKQCLKGITTARDSLCGVIDELTLVSDKVDPSIIPQLESIEKNISDLLSGLVGSKVTGPIISIGNKLEIEAAVRAVILSLFKLLSSFNSATLEQSILTEAKVASSCISQLWATLNENATTNTNLLSVPWIKEKIIAFATDIKARFSEFMNETKQQVANPSKNTYNQLKRFYEPIKSVLREVVANFQAFATTDTSSLQPGKASQISLTPKHYQRADEIVADPEPIVPPPPVSEKESAIDLPDNYVPEPEYIWDEPQVDEGRVLYTDSGALRCATLNKLIIYITTNETELECVKTFLTTFRSFTTCEVLLKKLVDRSNAPSNLKAETIKAIRLRCLSCLKQLIQTQSDNLSEEFMKQLEKTEGPDTSFGNMIRDTLLKKQESRQNTKNEIINLTIEEKIPLSPAKLLFVIDEEEIARQLTLVDFFIYQAIKPVELLNQAWSKAKYKYRAKNVLTLIARSTALTKWVASLITWQDTLRGRVRALTKIINIAIHLRKLNNFNSLMAVLAGINTSAVYRLKFTRDQLPNYAKQALQEISELMDPTSSYGNYRKMLHDIAPPCVPFLGTYLTDLTFIEDGNPDYIQGLINYRKRELVYSVIREIQQYQQASYTFELVNIAHFLTELPSNDENSLYDLSLLREPRNATIDQIV